MDFRTARSGHEGLIDLAKIEKAPRSGAFSVFAIMVSSFSYPKIMKAAETRAMAVPKLAVSTIIKSRCIRLR